MQTTPIEQSTRGFNLIFIHSTLDDSDLTPTQFRVLAHISRRASSGQAWPSAESIARACHINEDTVWDALKELQLRKMLTRRKRAGKTTMWTVNPPDQWLLHKPKVNPPEKRGRVNKPAPTGKEGVTTHPSLSATKDIQVKDIHCTSVAVGVSAPQVQPPKAAAAPEPVSLDCLARKDRDAVRKKIAEYPDVDGKSVAYKLQSHCDKPGNGSFSIERFEHWLKTERRALAVRFNDPNRQKQPADWNQPT